MADELASARQARIRRQQECAESPVGHIFDADYTCIRCGVRVVS